MDYPTACEWLNVDPSIVLDESILKTAFRRTAIREHPDKSQYSDATQRFQSVKRAHDFLIQCVDRGETGPRAPEYTDEDDDDPYGDYHNDDDEEEDDLMFAELLRQMFGRGGGGGFVFSHGPGGPTVHVRGPFPGGGGGFYGGGGGGFGGGARSSSAPQQYDFDDDEYYHRYYERKRQEAHRKKEAAQRNAEAQERRRADARQNARDEGRDCFEEWTVKQLQHEATRRGFTIRGLQRQSIVELLIDDERQKRERRTLKELAPLLEEWVEIVDIDDPSRKKLKGLKARVVNYDRDKGRYIVEWDDHSGKKKSQQHRDMYGDKNKASLKPENLVLWGSRPRNTSTAAAAPQQGEQKKSNKRERKETAAKQQQQQQQRRQDAPGVNNNNNNNNLPSSSYDTSKFIQHKVKCPVDKIPGELMEFTNPHIPGQKQRAVIPLDAKPGKYFKVLVPLPAKKVEPVIGCARCMTHVKPQTKKGDSNIDAVGETSLPVGLPLRSCAHYCCEDCFPYVQEDRKCPTCASPLPQPETLDLLPYLQALDNPPIALKEAFLEEYFAGKEAELTSAGKNEQGALEDASQKATRAVEKHYRRASIKVHPDRHGEEFRTEFDALTKARDILRETKLRIKYLNEMIDIACKVDPGYIPQSHLIWVQKHGTDAPEASNKAAPKPGRAETPLYLDGGIAFSQPKRPRVVVQDGKGRQIRLSLPISSSIGQFLSYCQSVTIIGNCGNLEEDETVLAHITKQKFDIQDREIRIKLLTLPEHGIWDISWCSFLVVDGIKRRTPYSAQTRIDARSQAQLSMAARKDGMETLARHWTNDIRSRLRAHKLVGTDDRPKVEASYAALHQGISKGRDVSEKLLKIIQNTATAAGADSLSSTYKALIAMLDEASDVQSQLEATVQSYGKRDSRKAFKDFIASKLEHGGSEAWMANVTTQELEDRDGDANRLYQLLIEGKKANSLSFSDSTIDAASKREDLFSKKQRETLYQRKVEVENLLADEMKEAVKKEKEENEVKRMEEMASRVKVKLGDFVKIQGLEGRADLNGSLGTYLGIAHDDRYSVRIHAADKDFALKLANFKGWDSAVDGIPIIPTLPPKATPPAAPAVGVAKPWTCGACTFVHNGLEANNTACEMCGADKGKGGASGDARGGPPANSSLQKKQAASDKGDTKSAKKAPQGTKKQPSKASEDPNTKQPSKAPEPKAKQPAKPERHTHNTATPPDPPEAKPKTKKAVNKAPSNTVDPSKKQPVVQQPLGKNCGLGLFCPDLRRGPDACPFEHLPEEIAVYHPEHPSAVAAAVLNTPLQPAINRESSTQVPSNSVIKPQPTKKSPEEAAAAKSVGSGSGDKRAGIHCMYKTGCTHLKRGPAKCKYYHSPEEIAKYHPAAASSALGDNAGSDAAASIKPPPTKSVARYKNGIDCANLRKGPSKCRFFHPVEEVEELYPSTLISGLPSPSVETTPGSAVASLGSSSGNKKKEGSVHRNFLVAADKAPFLVGKGHKRLLALGKKSGAKLDISRKADANGMSTLKISGTTESVEEAIKLVNEIILDKPKNPVGGSKQQPLHRNILVEATSIPILLSNCARLVKSVMQKTGANISVSRDADSNGCCNVSITGDSEAVQMAAKLVVDASLGANGINGHAGQEDTSLVSDLTGDDLGQPKPPLMTATSSGSTNDLLAFLQKQKPALKCSAEQFHKYLKNDDILTLSDLAEACKDEDYANVLQENGLKGFKRGPFVKAVQRAASCSL